MKGLWLKKNWLIGLVVLAVLLIGGGTAVLAASGDGPVSTNTGVYLDTPATERLAVALGLTPEELTGQLQTGKTLATIAQELNIPAADLIEVIVAPYAEHVALQVKYGYMTEEQADALLETARQRAASLLEQEITSTGGNTDWQQMADQCTNAMNNSGIEGNGGMMSGGMGSGMMGGDMMSGGMMSGGMMGGDMGSGMMGGGMMGSWEGNDDTTAPAPDSNTAVAASAQGQYQTGSKGGTMGSGMTGGGMMSGGMMGGGMMSGGMMGR